MTIYERIRDLRIKKGLSQLDLARLVGYQGRSAICKVENGERDISQSMIAKYANALGTTPTYLLYGNESPLPSNILAVEKRRIPVLGNVACGKPIFKPEDREIHVVSGTAANYDFCLIANGDSMINARILDGDVVLCQETPEVDNGQIAAVGIASDVTDEWEYTLKRVYYYPNENKIVLAAENPAFPPMIFEGEKLNDIKILGKAVAFQSDVK